ncbi:Adaptive-response sensory-kinase SasA [Candidatus Magnetaquicoccaceae bacterium FCR-1]|uniref:histidine kinase n=1 Tax=Candidatus Magnetaquiglobus chichijimensis TaxID=3141448 RepID=A0ABQ0C7W9_9PROT
MKSVAGQLRIGLSALLFSIFLILFSVNDRLTHGLADSMAWREITHKAEGLRALLVAALQHMDEPVNPCQEPPGSGLYCQWEVRRATGATIHRSPSLAGKPISLPEMSAESLLQLKLSEPEGGEMRVVALSTAHAGGTLILAVGQSESLLKGQLRKWRFYHLLFTFCVFFLFAALTYWHVTQQFEVFGQWRSDLERWRSGSGPRRLPPGPEEIQPLMRILEGQLFSEERSLNRVRRTLSHIGHTLRIPLTVLFHLAESGELRQHPAVREVLTEQTRLLERLIERHLRRASLAGRTTPGEFFSLGQELPALVRALDILYYDKAIDTRMRIPDDLNCPGNRDDFLELIGNLADNACKWAKSRIIISAGNEGGFWLTIEDDGPGVGEEQLAILRQWRGKRLDESRPGQGLGLMIAQDIVSFYDGEITLGISRELGGFMVSIRLKA